MGRPGRWFLLCFIMSLALRLHYFRLDLLPRWWGRWFTVLRWYVFLGWSVPFWFCLAGGPWFTVCWVGGWPVCRPAWLLAAAVVAAVGERDRPCRLDWFLGLEVAMYLAGLLLRLSAGVSFFSCCVNSCRCKLIIKYAISDKYEVSTRVEPIIGYQLFYIDDLLLLVWVRRWIQSCY